MDVELIYKKYFHDVFLYIRSLSKDEHLAEEIAQETFVKAMRQIGQLEEQRPVKAWLLAIARNTYYRHCKRMQLYGDKEIPAEMEDAAPLILDRIIEKEAVLNITQVAEDIPEPYHNVFQMRVYKQLSFDEIGNHYNRSSGWARVTYHRAKKMIQNRMHIEKGW